MEEGMITASLLGELLKVQDWYLTNKDLYDLRKAGGVGNFRPTLFFRCIKNPLSSCWMEFVKPEDRDRAYDFVVNGNSAAFAGQIVREVKRGNYS
jgi:hypothetical protein